MEMAARKMQMPAENQSELASGLVRRAGSF
jgi:hypothetical protein